jgi:acetolactate synthase-1/2/3 large subunit
MGFGLGAAIGAKAAKPDTVVLHMAGDGSFRMNCNELATVSKYKLPVITILFNNEALGMVRQWQGEFNNKRYSQTDVTNEVDYIKLAEAYGINGTRVRNEDELKKALTYAIDSKKAALIECIIGRDEKVVPFVPPGKPINEMLLK